MRILFASFVSHMPDSFGGLQSSVDALATALTARGHAVMVLGSLRKPIKSIILAKPEKEQFAVLPHAELGYPVARAQEPVEALPGILAGWEPDIAVLPYGGSGMAAMTALCLRAQVPTVLVVHNVEPREVSTLFPEDPLLIQLANSDFTARRMETLFGHRIPVIPPPVDPATCAIDAPARGQGDCVLMINPSISKGVDIFFRLAAARPDLRFVAVESWQVSPEWQAILHSRAAALGNVELLQPSHDMRSIYRRARLLLMPSSFEETWGRVVTEAQLNGIPVIASDRGALPETVGPGGLLVPIDQGLDPWLTALDRLTAAPDFYRELAQAALAHATRAELSVDRISEKFLALLQAHVSAVAAARP
ncbi:MAG: glycosyltransferase [Rhodospirillaceae bacterium]|nr:MAG: glycosyltransferase [Rhodospirillaceae bacterium]